jgi:hypothetical protein
LQLTFLWWIEYACFLCLEFQHVFANWRKFRNFERFSTNLSVVVRCLYCICFWPSVVVVSKPLTLEETGSWNLTRWLFPLLHSPSSKFKSRYYCYLARPYMSGKWPKRGLKCFPVAYFSWLHPASIYWLHPYIEHIVHVR